MNKEISINLTRISGILRRRFWSITVPSFVIALSVGLTGKFLIPKQYDATVAILPPSGGQISIPFGSVLKNILPGGLGLGGTGTKDVLALLQSRRMAEDVISKFNLMEYFKTDKLDRAIKRLSHMTKIKVDDETGVIYIKVRTESPQMSAEIANFYVENLERLNDELKLSVTKPFVKVLDPARPPDLKAWPKNAINTIITFIFLIIVLSAYFLYREYTYPFVRYPETLEDEFDLLGIFPSSRIPETEPVKNRIKSFLDSPVALMPVLNTQSGIEDIYNALGDEFYLLPSPLETSEFKDYVNDLSGVVLLVEFDKTPVQALRELKNLLLDRYNLKSGVIFYNVPVKFISKRFYLIFPELRSSSK